MEEKQRPDDSFSLIHYDLPFSATNEQFHTLTRSLLDESSRFRRENLPLIERLADYDSEPENHASVDWRRVLILLHECTHFWHAIGTTYGFHYMRATMAQSSCVRDLLKLLDSQQVNKFKLPVSQVDTSGFSHTARANIKTLLDRWWCLEWYKEALHGFSIDSRVSTQHFFDHVWLCATQSIHEFDNVEQTFKQDSTAGHLRLEYPTGAPDITPMHALYGLRLSGQAIMEAAALFQEILLMTQLRDLGKLDADYIEQRTVESPAYSMAYELLLEGLQLDSKNSPPREILNRVVPLLFDLALMGVCDRAYIEPRPTVLRWQHIHPGFRYYLAIEAIKQIGLRQLWHTRYLDLGYNRLIKKICDKYEWPTPVRLARDGKKRRGDFVSQYGDLIPNGMSFVGVNPTQDPIVTHFESAKVRSTYHLAFAETLAGFSGLFQQFQPPFIQFENQSLLNGPWAGYIFYQKAMRTIFLGTAEALAAQTLFNTGPSQFGKELDALFVAALWNKVGFDRARFE